jgi:uncharacterized membrane protein YsdA (DUF1294 family)
MCKSRPHLWHVAAASAWTLLLTFASWSATGWQGRGLAVLLWYLLAINVVTFAYFGYDKWQAQLSGPRVPERVLLGLALVGGTIGAFLGMRWFHHKTIKLKFQIVFWLLAILKVGVVLLLIKWLW